MSWEAWRDGWAGQIGGLGRDESRIEMAAALEDSHPEVRLSAVETLLVLSNWGWEERVRWLISRQQDVDFRVRRAALANLGLLVADEQMKWENEALRDQTVSTLLRALADPDGVVRSEAAYLLGFFIDRDHHSKDHLFYGLRVRLNDPEEQVRIWAAIGLTRYAFEEIEREVLPVVIAYILANRDHPERWLSAELQHGTDSREHGAFAKAYEILRGTLGRSDEAASFLLAAIYRRGRQEEDQPYSLRAYLMGAELGRDRVLAIVRQALTANNPDLRVSAAILLDSIGLAREVVPTWLDVLRRSDDRAARIEAINSLKWFLKPPDPRAIPSLKLARSDPDPEVRKLAAIAVEELEPAEETRPGTSINSK